MLQNSKRPSRSTVCRAVWWSSCKFDFHDPRCSCSLRVQRHGGYENAVAAHRVRSVLDFRNSIVPVLWLMVRLSRTIYRPRKSSMTPTNHAVSARSATECIGSQVLDAVKSGLHCELVSAQLWSPRGPRLWPLQSVARPEWPLQFSGKC